MTGQEDLDKAEIESLREDLADARVQIASLEIRRDELLQLIANISQSTPLPAEMEGWEGQRAALIAEIGTMRATISELRATPRDQMTAAQMIDSQGETIGRLSNQLAAERGLHQITLDTLNQRTSQLEDMGAKASRFASEISDLRHAIMEAVDTIFSHRKETQKLSAMRSVANRLGEPFSLDRVALLIGERELDARLSLEADVAEGISSWVVDRPFGGDEREYDELAQAIRDMQWKRDKSPEEGRAWRQRMEDEVAAKIAKHVRHHPFQFLGAIDPDSLERAIAASIEQGEWRR